MNVLSSARKMAQRLRVITALAKDKRPGGLTAPAPGGSDASAFNTSIRGHTHT